MFWFPVFRGVASEGGGRTRTENSPYQWDQAVRVAYASTELPRSTREDTYRGRDPIN